MTFSRVLCIAALVFSSQLSAGEAYVADDWQMERLFNPTRDDLQQEADGSVFIYSGLTDKVAERAMDEAFGRIESMMFVRTVVTDESAEPLKDEASGSFVVEDDGC